ncbi:hypothetical protein JNUCC1_00045 [Lentibacillus sp. JNUCC-1]|uniref:YlbE-like family protein n=1 Tax=Lentibacillus sp. JNUCC-1 TaxID=2654513 RepID=UPI0012E8654B|nr:YlbE-like family protein [Lentibacillus sp. JNUCC-1]MUV36244.1 hypothetical protein [Lentibacillus sp. JNUCC-1]
MQEATHQYLQSRPDLHLFVRRHPEWYRLLTREPEKMAELEKAAKVFYGKTWPQQVERAGQRLDMLHMLIQMASMMRE